MKEYRQKRVVCPGHVRCVCERVGSGESCRDEATCVDEGREEQTPDTDHESRNDDTADVVDTCNFTHTGCTNKNR